MRVTLDTLKTHRFPGHGELTLEWAGALLHTQARGPFNLEMVEQGLKLMAALGAQCWPAEGLEVELVEWHESMLMPPEAWNLFERKLTRFADIGRVPRHTLLVAPPDIEGRWLMVPRVCALWERSRPVEVFEQLAPAAARASELLAAASGRRSA
jgi:hypothetical protein